MRLSKIFLCLLVVLTMFSCRKDQSSELMPTTTVGPFEVVHSYTIDVQGLVTTPDGTPVSNALIKVADQEVLTTEAGSFYLEKLIAPETGLYLLADAEGHFKGGSTVYSNANNLYTVNITLIPYDQLISFDSGDGLDIVSDAGAKLSIKANTVIDENGNPYNGTVETYMYWIDPSVSNMPALSPGPLVGLQEDELFSLRSFGMIGVDMFGTGGESLNIAEGENASLSFPIPVEFLSDAPSEIDLWHFNEISGVWEAEGSAMLVNGSYEADVPHFSWWNCDVPFQYGEVCFSIVDELGEPLGNMQLELSSGQFGTASTWVGASGVYCNLVPLGEALTLSLFTFCGDVLLTESISPVEEGETIIIEVPLDASSSQEVNISGNVTCGSEGPVTNGLVMLNIGELPYIDYLDDQGNYSIDVIVCSQGPYEAEITAFDLDGLTNGSTIVSIDDQDVIVDVDGCNEDLGEQTMVVSDGNEATVFSICEANITPAEVTIIAKIEEGEFNDYVIIGVNGFDMGTFAGNVLGSISGLTSTVTEQGQASINITSYSDVPGESIAGIFEYGDVTGTFVAEVQ